MSKEKNNRLVANNKKAFHDYFIEEKYEAGIALVGTEVKSLRMGKCSIKESFVRIEDDGVYIHGMHISPYEKGNIFNKDPLRTRKLLLHKREINKLRGAILRRAIPSFRFRYISKTLWSKSRSALQKVRSCTTSVRTSRRRIREERLSEISRCGIWGKQVTYLTIIYISVTIKLDKKMINDMYGGNS